MPSFLQVLLNSRLLLYDCNLTVYDVTRRETFTNLADIWAKEIDLYSTNRDCIKMLVGNKVDKVFRLSISHTEWSDAESCQYFYE